MRIVPSFPLSLRVGAICIGAMCVGAICVGAMGVGDIRVGAMCVNAMCVGAIYVGDRLRSPFGPDEAMSVSMSIRRTVYRIVNYSRAHKLP